MLLGSTYVSCEAPEVKILEAACPLRGPLCCGALPCSRAWHTRSPQTTNSCLTWVYTLPATGSSLTGSPNTLSEGNRHCPSQPLWLRGGRGRRAQVQASDPFPPHTDPPSPLQSTRAPGPGVARGPRSRRVRERAAHNFAQLITAPLRLRGARAGRAPPWLTI